MNANMKVFEVRDRATMIPWLAFRFAYPMSPIERGLLRRAGFGGQPEEWDGVIQGPAHLDPASGDRLSYDVFSVKNERTRMAAFFIEQNFDKLESGQVIDVRVILGEASEPVESEIEL